MTLTEKASLAVVRRLEKTQNDARHHAETCRECWLAIIDAEGNPGFESEACKEGARILRAYVAAEALYWSFMEQVETVH